MCEQYQPCAAGYELVASRPGHVTRLTPHLNPPAHARGTPPRCALREMTLFLLASSTTYHSHEPSHNYSSTSRPPACTTSSRTRW
eukprot:87280-Prymnesium_polylepis.1